MSYKQTLEYVMVNVTMHETTSLFQCFKWEKLIYKFLEMCNLWTTNFVMFPKISHTNAYTNIGNSFIYNRIVSIQVRHILIYPHL